MSIEKTVAKLTRKYHPRDLGKQTSILENAIREALTQTRIDTLKEVEEMVRYSKYAYMVKQTEDRFIKDLKELQDNK